MILSLVSFFTQTSGGVSGRNYSDIILCLIGSAFLCGGVIFFNLNFNIFLFNPFGVEGDVEQ